MRQKKGKGQVNEGNVEDRQSEFGGEVPLIDLLDALSSFLLKDHVTGSKILEKLMPLDSSASEFQLFLIC